MFRVLACNQACSPRKQQVHKCHRTRSTAIGGPFDMVAFRNILIGCLGLVLASCSSNTDVAEVTRSANKYLWNASLETLSFLPLEQADPFSGLLVTGWGAPEGGRQDYRATVYVADAALDAASLKVAVFRRSGNREIPAARETVIEVENAILSRARELRIRDIRG